MNTEEKGQGGYTLPMALIILSLLFTIAGISVATLARQAEESRHFQAYQIFLLDCKTAMAECEAFAIADPEGLTFPREGFLDNAQYRCDVESRDGTGYCLLLQVKSSIFSQNYQGKVVWEISLPAETTASFAKILYLSAPEPQEPPLQFEPLKEDDQEEEPANLPGEESVDPVNPEASTLVDPAEEISPEDPPSPEVTVKRVSKVLWWIK